MCKAGFLVQVDTQGPMLERVPGLNSIFFSVLKLFSSTRLCTFHFALDSVNDAANMG